MLSLIRYRTWRANLKFQQIGLLHRQSYSFFQCMHSKKQKQLTDHKFISITGTSIHRCTQPLKVFFLFIECKIFVFFVIISMRIEYKWHTSAVGCLFKIALVNCTSFIDFSLHFQCGLSTWSSNKNTVRKYSLLFNIEIIQSNSIEPTCFVSNSKWIQSMNCALSPFHYWFLAHGKRNSVLAINWMHC